MLLNANNWLCITLCHIFTLYILAFIQTMTVGKSCVYIKISIYHICVHIVYMSIYIIILYFFLDIAKLQPQKHYFSKRLLLFYSFGHSYYINITTYINSYTLAYRLFGWLPYKFIIMEEFFFVVVVIIFSGYHHICCWFVCTYISP